MKFGYELAFIFIYNHLLQSYVTSYIVYLHSV